MLGFAMAVSLARSDGSSSSTCSSMAASSSPGAVVSAGLFEAPRSARIARSIAVSVMKQDYIEAGRAPGLSDGALFTRYLLRNCISSIMIFTSLRFGQIILIGAALSFLGLGARPPMAELGMMAAQGRDFLLFAPHIAVIPSVLIFIIVLAANILGDALRDGRELNLQPLGKMMVRRSKKLQGGTVLTTKVRIKDKETSTPSPAPAKAAAE